MPNAAASQTNCTVNERKKPAVPTAATRWLQLGPGMMARYCGRASTGLVTMVSRSPVTVPGRKFAAVGDLPRQIGLVPQWFAAMHLGMLRAA